MDAFSTVFFLGAVLIADLIGTIAGFGTATTLTPAASFFIDIKSAIAVVAIIHICSNIFKIFLFRAVAWEVFIPFGAASVIFSFLGATLWINLPTEALERIFGLFLIGYSSYSLTHRFITLPPKTRVAIVGGVASGISAGVLGTGGALRSLFLNAFLLRKESYVATAAALAIATDATRLPVYLNHGIALNRHLLGIVALAIPVSFLGTWLGRRLVAIIPQTTFRKLVLVALLVVGIKFVFW